MEYSVAKELHDAGFPQGGKGTWVYPLDALRTRPSDRIYAPTLEELIEACGGAFGSLERMSYGVWYAVSMGKDYSVSGPGSAVAVARLWLVLNKKEK